REPACIGASFSIDRHPASIMAGLWGASLGALICRKGAPQVGGAPSNGSDVDGTVSQLLSKRSARRFSSEHALALVILYSQPLVWLRILSAISLASPSPVAATESQ